MCQLLEDAAQLHDCALHVPQGIRPRIHVSVLHGAQELLLSAVADATGSRGALLLALLVTRGGEQGRSVVDDEEGDGSRKLFFVLDAETRLRRSPGDERPLDSPSGAAGKSSQRVVARQTPRGRWHCS